MTTHYYIIGIIIINTLIIFWNIGMNSTIRRILEGDKELLLIKKLEKMEDDIKLLRYNQRFIELKSKIENKLGIMFDIHSGCDGKFQYLTYNDVKIYESEIYEIVDGDLEELNDKLYQIAKSNTPNGEIKKNDE